MMEMATVPNSIYPYQALIQGFSRFLVTLDCREVQIVHYLNFLTVMVDRFQVAISTETTTGSNQGFDNT